jgi:hypothetical protein
MEMVPPLASVMQSRVNPWRFSSLTPDCGALSDAWSVDCFFSWLYPSLITLVIVSNVLMSGGRPCRQTHQRARETAACYMRVRLSSKRRV